MIKPKSFHNLYYNPEQRTANEVEDQIYHLSERLKIQLLDEVKSVYNGQMTKTVIFQQKNVFQQKLFRSNTSTFVFRTIIASRKNQKVFCRTIINGNRTIKAET